MAMHLMNDTGARVQANDPSYPCCHKPLGSLMWHCNVLPSSIRTSDWETSDQPTDPSALFRRQIFCSYHNAG